MEHFKVPLFHHLSSFFILGLKITIIFSINQIYIPTMSNPAATATNCPTQKHKLPKYFKGEKVAKHPDLVTISVNFVFILFDNFSAFSFLPPFLRPVNSSLL